MIKLLLFLRLISLLLLIFINLSPTKTITENPNVKSIIPILVDTSASMNIKDGGPRRHPDLRDNKHRWTLVKNFLNSNNIIELNKKYSFVYYSFSETAQKTDKEKLLEINEPAGKVTDIALSLEQVTDEIIGKEAAGIILVTDGAHNVEKELLNSLKNIKYPVYTIGVGSDKIQKDFEVLEVNFPSFIFKGITVDLPVIIRSAGFKGKIPVILKKGNSPVEKIYIDNEAGENKEYSVKFKIKAEEIGTYDYSVIIPGEKDEISVKNNEIFFNLKVIKDKIRILLISGKPTWEYRFLRDILKNYPNIELVSFTILRNPTNLSIFPETELTLIQFPSMEIFMKELFNFDLLIFDNFTYTKFMAPNLLESVKKFVIENGGGFLMTGGENSFGRGGYKGTAIEEILPVEIEGPKEEIIEKQFKPKFINKTHPIINFTGTKSNLNEILENIPYMEGINRTKAKKDSTVLAVYKSGLNEEIPVISLIEPGKGRVAAITSGSTWRLRFQLAKEGKNNIYNDFWLNCIRWLVNAPFLKPLQVNLDKNSYLKEEEIKLNIKTLNQYYQPDDSEINIILDINGKKKDIGKPIRLGKGEYEYGVEATSEGKYDFTVTSIAEGKIERENISCNVSSKSLELTNSNLHENILKNISDSTGGKYYRIDAEGLAGELLKAEKIDIKESKSKKIIVKKKIDLWHNIIVFSLIILSLILELYLRRKKGYV